MNSCNNCPLAINNNFKSVKARGDINSKLFIIGEAPGYKEKKVGKAFVGRTGMYLQRILELHNLEDNVYLTNIVKCRPPFNRTPTWGEIAACKPKLINEIRLGRPRLILLLGNTAVNGFFNKEINSITKLNNKHIKIGNTYILFGFHPRHVMQNPDKEEEYHKLFYKIRGLYKILINKYI